jgi:hypothetical protein
MKSVLGITIVTAVIFLSGISVSFYLVGHTDDTITDEKSYTENWEKNEQHRREIEKNPTKKISTKYLCSKIANNEVIEVKGTITNTSSMATFKDLNYKVEFYDSENTILATTTITIQQYITPGKTHSLNEKFLVSDAVKRVELVLLDAKAI